MDKRVLIFDDDKDILNICTLILRSKDYEVFSSSNCADLFHKIFDANPSVIVMDNQMPGLCGADAVKIIKADPRTRSIPVILFSANTHVAEISEEAGADFYLQKPFDIKEFEDLLDNTVEGLVA